MTRILTILLIVGLLSLVNAKEDFQNYDWKSRLKITIKENSGKTLRDYQIKIELNSRNFRFEKALPNGADIRFIDSGKELNYWIEEWDLVKKKAVIWVKVPEIPANGEKIIYLYYGNPKAKDKSNGDKVFELFDDFNDGVIDKSKWKIYLKECNQYSCCHLEWGHHCNDCCSGCKNSKIVEERGMLRIKGIGNCCWCKKGIESRKIFSNNFSVVVKYRDEVNCWFWGDKWIHTFIVGDLSEERSRYVRFARNEHSWGYAYKPDNSDRGKFYDIGAHDTSWHRIEIKKKDSRWKINFDGSQEKTFSPITYSLNKIAFFVSVAEVASRCPGAVADLDYVFVRKYIEPEPTVTIGEKDLSIKAEDISFSNPSPKENEAIKIFAEIHYEGDENLSDVLVRFYEGNPSRHGKLIGERRIAIEANGSKKIEISYNVSGSKEIYVFLDPKDEISEIDEENNLAFKRLSVSKEDYFLYILVIEIILLLVLSAFILFLVYKSLSYKKPSSQAVECPRCGMILPNSAKECPVCGNKIK